MSAESRPRHPGPEPDASTAMDTSDVYQEMMQMILSFWVTQTLRAVADLSLADHLAEGGLTAAGIAEREGSAPDNTFRLLRAGVALGLMTADAAGRFYGTERLATLRKDAPRSLRPMLMSFTAAEPWQRWIGFLSAVRRGHGQPRAAVGSDFFADGQRNPEWGAEFSAAMTSTTALWSHNIADVIDTTNVRCVVDVGGANGTLVRFLQQANPALHAVVFDQPIVAEQTRTEIAQFGFPDRTDVVAGDFFRSVPPGDLYLLKFILHDWDDQSCIEILRQCRKAALPGARIAIIEFIVGDLADPGLTATMSDIAMLALMDGRERTLGEFDSLLAAAGLRRTAVRATVAPQSVIEATID